LFALVRGGSAVEFGSAVHAMLAEIEWWDLTRGGEDAKKTMATLEASGEAGVEAAGCLRAAALAGVWARPRGAAGAAVWRERAFEVVLEGAWVTGVFDRVIVECDAEARPVRATVFDFKTDRVGPEDDLATSAQRHSGQLAVYRRVVAMLTGISPERVTCEVVFTRVRRCVEVGF
jgi:hypothetical protein